MKRHVNDGNEPWRGAESERRYVNRQIAAAPARWRRCLRQFAEWLESERGLAASTITIRVASARGFVETIGPKAGGGVRALRKLGVVDVEDAFIAYSKEHGRSAQRSMQAAMRLFLRFAVQRKWIALELAEAVPTLCSYRGSGVPRGLAPEAVDALIRRRSKRSLRDQAILVLLAVYGVRRGQVAALDLSDIDWRGCTITFAAHKGGKKVRHRLLDGVAAVLSSYLLEERPESQSRAVFLRSVRPHLAINPAAISAMVSTELGRVGIESTPRGPHALRHAFATRLLHSGQPLKIIADLLGHQTLAEVSTYAKVDHPRLLEVASTWPEVVR